MCLHPQGTSFASNVGLQRSCVRAGVSPLAPLPTFRLCEGKLGIQLRGKMEIRQNIFLEKVISMVGSGEWQRVFPLTSSIVRGAPRKTQNLIGDPWSLGYHGQVSDSD